MATSIHTAQHAQPITLQTDRYSGFVVLIANLAMLADSQFSRLSAEQLYNLATACDTAIDSLARLQSSLTQATNEAGDQVRLELAWPIADSAATTAEVMAELHHLAADLQYLANEAEKRAQTR